MRGRPPREARFACRSGRRHADSCRSWIGPGCPSWGRHASKPGPAHGHGAIRRCICRVIAVTTWLNIRDDEAKSDGRETKKGGTFVGAEMAEDINVMLQ